MLINSELENILQHCRLCQENIGTLEIANDAEFALQTAECTNVQVNDSATRELLPKAVCLDCKVRIETFFIYLQQVREVDKNLKRLLECSLNNVGESKLFGDSLQAEVDTAESFCEVKESNLVSSPTELIDKTENTSTYKACEQISTIKYESAKHERSCRIKKDCGLITENKSFQTIHDENSKSGNEELDGKIKFKKKSKGGFKCKTCQEVFVYRVDLWVHKKGHKNLFVCKREDCGKICTSAYTLKTHEMKHEGKRPFLCVTCGKGFITKNSLNCHEKIHLETKGYMCKLCNIGFSVRSNLRAHEKKHHEGVRFYCSQCTRAFITKCSLERHERMHTGIKEYKCASCPSAFYTNKELIKHQRYHQGIRQHKCDQCFKTFFEKHHLTVHLRAHTGERPYICRLPGCEKSFTESQKLTRHLKARHPLISSI